MYDSNKLPMLNQKRKPTITKFSKVKTQKNMEQNHRNKSLALYQQLKRQKLLKYNTESLLDSKIRLQTQETGTLFSKIQLSDNQEESQSKYSTKRQQSPERRLKSKLDILFKGLNDKTLQKPDKKNSSRRKGSRILKAKNPEKSILNEPIIEDQYQRIINAYEQYIEALRHVNRMQTLDEKINNQETVYIQFVEELKLMNNFFYRISNTVSIGLLKVGRIKIIEENKYMYRQGQRAESFFIVLWGKIKLKTKHSNVVYYCITGETMGEETVVTKNPINKNHSIHALLSNGKLRGESAKTLYKTAVLELKLSQFNRMRMQLLVLGQKYNILLVEKILGWGLIKKSKFRKG